MAAEKPQASVFKAYYDHGYDHEYFCMCIGPGSGRKTGLAWAGMIPEQFERRGEKTLQEIKEPRSLLRRFGVGVGGALARKPGGSAELHFCRPQEGARAVVGQKDAWSTIRVARGSRSSQQETPRPQRLEPLSTHCRRPFPKTVRSTQAPGGRGLRPLPLFPALRCPAQPDPARPGPARQHSRLRQLRRLLPCPGFSPTHSRPSNAAGSEPRGAWRVGTRGEPLHPELEAALRSAPSLRWRLSRRWEVWSSLCAQRGLRLWAPWVLTTVTDQTTFVRPAARSPLSAFYFFVCFDFGVCTSTCFS